MKSLRPLTGLSLLCVLAAFGGAKGTTPSSPQALPAGVTAAERILVLGDSITYGGLYVEYFETFLRRAHPEWRGELLNLGLPSETVSGLSEDGHAGGQFPRPDLHERLDRVFAQTKPNLVIACYGMNDGIYLPFEEDRFRRFQEGIRRLRDKAQAAGAAIIHLTPPTFDPKFGRANLPAGEDYNTVLDRYSDWLLAQRRRGWTVIDLHGPMNRHLAERRAQDPDYRLAGDGVHPNETGHWLMAVPLMIHFGAPATLADTDTDASWLRGQPDGAEFFRLVQERQRLLKDAWLTATRHQRPGMRSGLPLEQAGVRAAELDRQIRALNWPMETTRRTWNGFERQDFSVAGRTLSVIVPRQPLPGRLWAWKGEFLDAFPKAEIALLERGVFIVYLSVPDLLGCPSAVALWNRAYETLTGEYGFAARPALIALSRAGLYCYNWAIANPNHVGCIYADAAVCDFKSWPGGRGKGKGSERDWRLVLEHYGFSSDAEALAYRGNPVDNLEPLARAGVPLLHVYGEADDVVPWEENTGLVAERYRALGGSIALISKPGVGHHPHGLDDPTPIADFILRHLQAAPAATAP